MTNIYEIKVKGRWQKVRATSMLALHNWCELMGINQWRMVGMLSQAELIESQSLPVIA